MIERLHSAEQEVIESALHDIVNEHVLNQLQSLEVATYSIDELRNDLNGVETPTASSESIEKNTYNVLKRTKIILTLFKKITEKVGITLSDSSTAQTLKDNYWYFFDQSFDPENSTRTDILCQRIWIDRNKPQYKYINNLLKDIIWSYTTLESKLDSNSLEEIRNLHILNEYLLHYITEMDIRIWDYLLRNSLDKATNVWQLSSLKEYEEKYEQYNAYQKKISEDINKIQQNLLILSPDIFENSQKEVEDELNNQKGKSKLRRLRDVLTGKDTSIKIKTTISQENKDMLRRYKSLLEMHNDYSKHIATYSFEKVSEFNQIIQEKKETLLIEWERHAVYRLWENILNEAVVVWWNELEWEQKEKFLSDFFDLYKNITQWIDLTDTDKNITPLDNLFWWIKSAPQLFSLLIRHEVFDSTIDIARNMWVYNGKKMLHMSLKSVKVWTSAWINALVSPWVSIDLENELQEKLLFWLDTNSQEALLALIFRQSRVIGKYWTAITNWLISATSSLMSFGLKEWRWEIWNALQSIKWIQKNMSSEQSRFYELLNVVNKQLWQSNIASLDAIMWPNWTMSKLLNEFFMTIQWSWFLVWWEQTHTNTTFKNAQEARQSLQSFIQSKWIRIDEHRSKWLQSFETDMSKYWDRTTNNGWKKQIGKFIENSISTSQEWLVDSLKNNNKIKTFLWDRGLYTFLRNSVSNIINTTSDIALIFKQHFTLQSYRWVWRIWTLTWSVINNARFFSWVNELTQQSKQWFVKFWSAADIKEFNAMMQTWLKYFPQFIWNIVRSSPIAFMIQAKSSEETQLELWKLAWMLIPIIWPCLIIDDALGSQWIKFWELALWIFFLWLETWVIWRATLKYWWPFSSRWAVAWWMKAVELLFDPFIATKDMVVSPLHTAQTWTNIASNAAKIAKESWALQTALARVWMVSAVVWVSIFGIKKWLDYSHFEKVRSYIEIRSWKRKYEWKSWEAWAKEFLAQYREEMPIWNKEQILQRELTYFSQEIYLKTPELRTDWTYRSQQPTFFIPKITYKWEILVELASPEILSRNDYWSFSEWAKHHILWILPPDGSITFKNDLESFYYWKSAFVSALEQFIDSKNLSNDEEEIYLDKIINTYEKEESFKKAFNAEFVAFIYKHIASWSEKDQTLKKYDEKRIVQWIDMFMKEVINDYRKAWKKD
jgi:hypothetical protein